jgi:ATP-dependent DNA helicase RecQ
MDIIKTVKSSKRKQPISYNDIVKKYWGYSEIKDKQYEVIDTVIKGNDVIGLLPTGYGKSMCYLIPPLFTSKVMFVISPLISLMEDQKEKLLDLNISVSTLHGNNMNRAKDIIDIIDGKIKIVYMSPEYLVNGDGLDLAKSLNEMGQLGYLAIDESHCISMWGHDFRSSYMKINKFRKLFPLIPIMAVTATATQQVVEDIIKNLSLTSPLIVKANFDRPNLYLKCESVNKISLELLEPYIKKYKDDKMIIYTNSRKDTTELAQSIMKEYSKKYSINCMAYHAGISKGCRNKIQTQFSNGDINIIVGTVAFGMGIDQIVRCVVIFGAPNSIEDYYQMIGRAGRDNYMAETVLFFQYKNIIVGKHMNLKNKTVSCNSDDESEESSQLLENKQKNLNTMAKFFFTNICRRRFILEYFGQISKFFCCNNCDNCKERELFDYTDRIKQVLFDMKGNINDNILSLFTKNEIDIMAGSNFIKINKFNTITTTLCLENWKQLIIINKKINNIPNKYRLLFGKNKKEDKKIYRKKKV